MRFTRLNESLVTESFVTRELINEINNYLKNKNHPNLSVDMYTDEDGYDILYSEVYNGDWKHEHGALQWLITEFFLEHPTLKIKDWWTTDYEGSDGDWYSQNYHWLISSKKHDLNEGASAAVISAAKTILPKLHQLSRHIPEILQGLDLVKDFYDGLDSDNEVKKYLDSKGAKEIKDTYDAVRGLYKVIKGAKESAKIEESTESTRHCIVGIDHDGNRNFYTCDGNWSENDSDACTWTNINDAREVWMTLPRNGFERIVVPVYDSVRKSSTNTSDVLVEGTGAQTAKVAKDAMNILAQSDKNQWASTTSQIIESIPDEFADELFDEVKSNFSNVRLSSSDRRKLAEVADGVVEEEKIEDADTVGKLLDLFDPIHQSKKNPGLIKGLITVTLGIIAMVEPTPVVEVITAIIMMLPDTAVAKIYAILNIIGNPVGGVAAVANALHNKK